MYGGKFAFQNRLNQLVVGGRFTIVFFVLLCIRGEIPITSPRGSYIRRGDLTRVFCVNILGGLYLEGAYTWRGLFSEFYGITVSKIKILALNCHSRDISYFPKQGLQLSLLRELARREGNRVLSISTGAIKITALCLDD